MNIAQHILVFIIRVYQWTLSPVLGFFAGPSGGCRYTPTCSHYAVEALRRHGVMAGSWLALKRICRCHPWGGCGCDPVPSKARKPIALQNSNLKTLSFSQGQASHGS